MSGGSPIAPGALCLEPCWVKKRKKETGQNYYLSTAVLWHGQVGANGIKKIMDEKHGLKTWMKNTVLLLFVTKQGWYSVKKWVGWRYKCHVRAGEIWNQAETNPIQRFPKFDGLSQPLSSFEDVFRHFVMNLSDFFWLHSHFSVHGRAHHSFPTSLAPNKSLYLASTFSASPHRGLRHSSQNQKQIQITIWWWDEVPCLLVFDDRRTNGAQLDLWAGQSAFWCSLV